MDDAADWRCIGTWTRLVQVDDTKIPDEAREAVLDAVDSIRGGLRSGGFHELEARFADFWFLTGKDRMRLLAEATAALRGRG